MLPSGGTEGQESDDLTFFLLEQNRIDLMICVLFKYRAVNLELTFLRER